MLIFALGGLPDRVSAEAVAREVDPNAHEAGDRCEAAFPSPPGTICRVEDPTKPVDTLLLGDSHARAFFPALLGSGNARMLVHPGCFPAPGLDSHNRRDFVATDCQHSNDRHFELASSDPAIQTVLLVARGNLYVTGSGYGQVEDLLYDWSLTFRGAPMANTAAVRAGLGAALDDLRRAKKDVVVVLQVPELGFAIQECLALRPVDRLRTLRQPCAIPRHDAEARQASYRALVADVAAGREGVRVVDPWEVLCDETWCHAMLDGVVLYADDDHLSPDGARALWRRLGTPRKP
jgi:hypothetical protein